jgi:ribonuclease HI
MKSLKIPNDIDQTKYIEISFEQNSQQSESKLINAYTDGSRIEKDSTHQTGAGAIIYIDNQEIILKESLAPENTINQAELLAIHLVTKKLLEMETKESHLVIHTDSSTTLKRLTRSYSNSKQLTETIRSLHELQS